MNQTSVAYNTGQGTPEWLNKGDNAWQITAATLVGIQSLPGLVILYGSYVKKKWAVNSTFMALYAFAVTLPCWMLFAYKMSFGERLFPFWGRAGPALTHEFLLNQSVYPASGHAGGKHFGQSYDSAPPTTMLFPMVTTVFYQFAFAALTLILVAGSLLGRMHILAWMIFAPFWLTFSYTVGAFSLWGGGFLYQLGVIDYCGGYVIHLSSGIAGFTAAYWVGPRSDGDRKRFPPNNLLLMLAGAGLLWLGWSGFNGGGSYSANTTAAMAIINTHICAATSLLVWLLLDRVKFGWPSVIGAIQGMITGLVCITPAAGIVEPWAAMLMGVMSGSIPWFTMNIVHKKFEMLKKVDDTMAVFHTHAVAGIIGGISVGLFTEPILADNFSSFTGLHGLFYYWKGHHGFKQGLKQIGLQLVGALFVIVWNVLVTSLILFVIQLRFPLRMSDVDLAIGDDAVHGEEAYALWGDGQHEEPSLRHDGQWLNDKNASPQGMNGISHGPTAYELAELHSKKPDF